MIHLYRFQDLNIVLDVNSGAVHAVSDSVFDILFIYDKAAEIVKNGVIANNAKQFNDSENIWYASSSSAFRNDDSVASASHNYTRSKRKDSAKSLRGKYPEVVLQEAQTEIDELISAGMLFTPEPDENDVSPEGRDTVIKAMCLHVAHDCNMRCTYCFADSGGFAGSRSLMPLETGKRAIDFLLEQSGKRHNLEIDFFGGEPLMNFEVVKGLVLYGHEREKEYGKHIRFTLTTNGLLLDDDKTAFINEHMDNVILSIDGRPDVNDRMRKTVGGEGTYARIIDKLTRFVKARRSFSASPRCSSPVLAHVRYSTFRHPGPLRPDLRKTLRRTKSQYYVRGTYTAFNKNFSEDVRHLASLGFDNISVEPAVTAADEPWALTENDLPELFAEYDRLTDLIFESEKTEKPVSFFHFKVDLAQGPCVYKRASGCGAGTAYVAVTPDGDIYPCHQFVGEKPFLLGNVYNDSFENRLAGTFEKAHIFAKKECRNCWAKYYCSGGCHAAAAHFSGDLMKPHRFSCELEKKRLECAIGLAAKRTLL